MTVGYTKTGLATGFFERDFIISSGEFDGWYIEYGANLMAEWSYESECDDYQGGYCIDGLQDVEIVDIYTIQNSNGDDVLWESLTKEQKKNICKEVENDVERNAVLYNIEWDLTE